VSERTRCAELDEEPTISYLEFMDESSRRARRREGQTRCPRCRRWYWDMWRKDASRHALPVRTDAYDDPAQTCFFGPRADRAQGGWK
jgi:hypothetical protein